MLYGVIDLDIPSVLKGNQKAVFVEVFFEISRMAAWR